MDNQRTIAKEIKVSGVGLHTAGKVTMTFKPAPEHSGIIFIRTDLPARPVIKAAVDSLLYPFSSQRRTSIGADGVAIHTIEHLMAALSGLGIDNLIIEIDSDEIPGLDGSSINFIESLQAAGIHSQSGLRGYFSVKEPLAVEEEGSSITILPANEFKVSYTLSYDHPLLRGQFLEVALNEESFIKELASARTFCLEDEASKLKEQGLGCGADYHNTLVIGKNGVIKNKLRFEDEFVRHKMLDLIGDLSLLGQPLKGHVIAIKSGHMLNLKLLRKIDQQRKRLLSGGIAAGPKRIDSDGTLCVEQIMGILPHREPFLFVDRITHLEKGKRATGIKNVTINDYFFKGHFPGRPVMPGVIILEAMAQVGGVMMLAPDENRGKLAFFMAINNVKFRKTVVPGDQLVFEVEAGRIKARTGQVFAKAYVDGKIVCEAELMFALADA